MLQWTVLLKRVPKDFRTRPYILLDDDFGAADGFAGKTANFASFIRYYAVVLGVNCVVAAHSGAFASAFGHANLADDNLPSLNRFSAK